MRLPLMLKLAQASSQLLCFEELRLHLAVGVRPAQDWQKRVPLT